MKKFVKIALIASILAGTYASANYQGKQEGFDRQGPKHERMQGKMKNMNIEDMKKMLSERISKKEASIAKLKQCLTINKKRDFVYCVKSVKKEFKHHRGNKMGKHKERKFKRDRM